MCKKLTVLLVLALVLGQLCSCATPSAPGETDPDAQSTSTSAPEENLYLQYYDPEWEHILTHSPEDLVEREYLLGLDMNELILAKNEIYARHGFFFSDEALLAYFNRCSWYQPDPNQTAVSTLPLTDLERQAISVIEEYEKNPGYDPSKLDTRLCQAASCQVFSVLLPAYWKESCTLESAELQLRFYQSLNYAQFGGHLFSICLFQTMEEVEYLPDYRVIGTMAHTDGTRYYVVVIQPTDVQFDAGDLSVGQYRFMCREMDRILDTIEGINGYTYTPL